jgi:G3E family GTPase
MTKTPITIFSGHLGSGKTTLIQEILELFPEKKILVIENEFGEVGIDGEILSQNKNALVELNAGCVCCNIQSDLERILEKFIEEKHEFDHIIIEATGVANPAKIATQFVEPRYLSQFFTLNSILCVIDSLHYKSHKKLSEFELQVLTSDSFYLSNKAECSESELVDICKSLSIAATDVVKLDMLREWFVTKSFHKIGEDISLKGGHSHYEKLSLELIGDFDPFTLENYLNVLFTQYMGRIFRCKGVLFFKNAPMPVLLQGVFDSLSFSELEIELPEIKKNRIVLIGKDLDQKSIEASFKNCLAT